MQRHAALIAFLLGLLLLGTLLPERTTAGGVTRPRRAAPDRALAAPLALEASGRAPELGVRTPVALPEALRDSQTLGTVAPQDHAGLLVVLTGDAPPQIDLHDWAQVELWDSEPAHLLAPAPNFWWDPEALDSTPLELEQGWAFEAPPPQGPLWVSVVCPGWSDELWGCDPVYAEVPPRPPAAGPWIVEVPVQMRAWVHGSVAGVPPETDWELSCEETGQVIDGSGPGTFSCWPVPAGPVTLTLTTTEEGRAVHRRYPVRAPRSGGADAGVLRLAGGSDRLRGRVQLEDGTGVETSLEVTLKTGAPFGFETDPAGFFTIEGDLAELAGLIAYPPDYYAFEPASLALPGSRDSYLALVLQRRPEQLLDLIVSPRLAGGEYVKGDLVFVLEHASRRYSKLGANHRGWCGAGIFSLRGIPPGRARFTAWIPERGLSGAGVVSLERPLDEEQRLNVLMRESGTRVSGQLVVRPGTNPPGWDIGVEALATIGGDLAAAHEWEAYNYPYEWIPPGRFSLLNLPAGCDLHLVLRNQPGEVLFERDLRLQQNEHLELGVVVVQRP